LRIRQQQQRQEALFLVPVFVTNENKATDIQDKLVRVTDAYVRISLELQREFGLRREEATKFQPRYADQGDHLRIKGSWTKGGRERVIPITTAEQRATLDEASAKSAATWPIRTSPQEVFRCRSGA
jgi:hypothetical protein